jgi:isopentenyl phosphate kinase
MKPLYVLKIGGSVATYKDRRGFSVRKSLLKKIAINLKKTLKSKKFHLILVHGAGAMGHQLAKKYALQKGTGKNQWKIKGALLSQAANKKLNVAINKILKTCKLNVFSVHPSVSIIQKNGKIVFCDIKTIKKCLQRKLIPLLYGEMVFDKKTGFSVCSGDAIVAYLAKKFEVQKIFFASDVNGIFEKDPYIYKKAKLVQKINLSKFNRKIKISQSHNKDVTGGLLGKIEKMRKIKNSSVKTIEIFNGLKPENFSKTLLGITFEHTVIE